MKLTAKQCEYVIVSIIIVLAVLASISQTILYVLKTPPGHTFLFIHNYIEDYYYYLHLMRQGWEGNWLATSWLTPEVFPGAFVNVWFLLLGHLAKFMHLSLPVMYLTSRIAGAGVLLYFSYLLIGRVFSDSRIKRIVALLFVSFSTYWWGWTNSNPTVAPLVHDWTELDPLFRLSYMPHHLWAKICMVAAFLMLLKQKNLFGIWHLPVWQAGLAFSIVVVAMGLTNPVAYATFVPVVLLWLLLSLKLLNRSQWMSVGIAVSVVVMVSIYHRGIQMTMFPWTTYIVWEKVQYAIFYSGYVQALGPAFPLFFIAVPWLWKKGIVGRLLIAWAGASWVGLVLSPFIPLSNSRYLGGYQFIPLGIGATAGIWQFRKTLVRTVLLVFLFFYFAIGLFASWKEHVGYREQNKGNIQVYVPNGLMDAFGFIEKNTPKDAIIAAPYEISTMIPAMTGRRVLVGHPLMTFEANKKQEALAYSDTLRQFGATHQLRIENGVYHVAELR